MRNARNLPLGPELTIPRDHPFYPIIADAYRVFATPKPDQTGVCVQCCMDADIEADFFTPAIEAMPFAYVRDWYEGAFVKWGVPKESWTYLLPRVLEMLALDEMVDHCGLEVTLYRFETGNPVHWNAAQWDVLERFRHAYFARALIDFENCPLIDDAVCMFALAGWSLDSILAQVSAAEDAVLAQRLCHDWCVRKSRGGRIWITAFWEGPGRSIVYDFYTSADLYRRMEALALSDDVSAEIAEAASRVAEVIEAAQV